MAKKQPKKQKSYGGLVWLRKLITTMLILGACWLAYDYHMSSQKVAGANAGQAARALATLQGFFQGK